MKFKIPKHFFSLLLTTTFIFLSIITPAIIFGIKANRSNNDKRIPYHLFTPLPAEWYLAGDIEEFDRAIFQKSFNLYEEKNFLDPGQKNIAFAKLTNQNLNDIKDFYENPILDITFDANYSYVKNETNINMPKELDFPIDKTEVKKIIDTFKIEGNGTNKVIPGENTISGFSLKLLNDLYRRINIIKNDPAKFGYNPDDMKGINSYLYMIDKDLDRSNNNHNYYRIQVWPSRRVNLSTHTDGKNLETIGDILKHTYNIAPTSTSVLVKAWELGGLGGNTFGASLVDEDFCYSDDTIPKPVDLSSMSDADFKKALRYLCAPIGDNPDENNLKSSLTIHKGIFNGISADEAKKFQTIPRSDKEPEAKNFHFTLGKLTNGSDIFQNIKLVYDYYHTNPSDEIWFDATAVSNTNEILLKIKDTKFQKLNKLAYNRRNGLIEWKFVWSQAIDNNAKLMGWWTIYDITGNNEGRKVFPGQFYEKIIDNPSATELIQCDTFNNTYEYAEDKLSPDSICQKVTVNENKYAEIYGADVTPPDKPQHLYFKNDDFSLGRSYTTYPSGSDNNTKIINFIKELQIISKKILNSEIFMSVSQLANEALGGEFVEMLRSIGSWNIEYWNEAIELLIPYIEHDKTIYWKTFIPQPIEEYDSTEKAENGIKNMKFGDFLNWFGNDSMVNGKTLSAQEKIKNYLINGFLAYGGFHSHAYTMANFKWIGNTPTILGTPPDGYEVWREVGAGNTFDTTTSGIIALIIKYGSIIAYNYDIYEEKIRKTNNLNVVKANRLKNLEAMLHSTYPIGPSDPLKNNYFHNKDEVNQSTNNAWPPSSSSNISIKFNDIKREINLFQFEPWLQQILGQEIK